MNRKYDANNIFAKIIRKEIIADIIYEDEDLLCFKDINPIRKIHVLVIPKKSYLDYSDFIQNASNKEIMHYFCSFEKIVTNVLNIKKDGFSLLINKGENSGQTVFHFHTHILSGQEL